MRKRHNIKEKNVNVMSAKGSDYFTISQMVRPGVTEVIRLKGEDRLYALQSAINEMVRRLTREKADIADELRGRGTP